MRHSLELPVCRCDTGIGDDFLQSLVGRIQDLCRLVQFLLAEVSRDLSQIGLNLLQLPALIGRHLCGGSGRDQKHQRQHSTEGPSERA